MHAFLRVIALLAVFPVAAVAQTQLAFYGGTGSARGSNVSGVDPAGIGAFDFLGTWQDFTSAEDARYGVRVTWWQDEQLGWGVDLNHSPLRADQQTLANNGLNEFEFANGSNLLTVNAYRRWQEGGALVPYVGAGLGLSIPRVVFDAGGARTSQYQITGPAVQWYAGASYPLTERLSVFGEYKGSYSSNWAQLVNGGSLNANVLSSELNVGLSLGF